LFVADVSTTTIYSDDDDSGSGSEETGSGTYSVNVAMYTLSQNGRLKKTASKQGGKGQPFRKYGGISKVSHVTLFRSLLT